MSNRLGVLCCGIENGVLCLHPRRAISTIVKVNATYTEVGQITRADRTYAHYVFHGA